MGLFTGEALFVCDDVRVSLDSHKPLLYKEMHYIETKNSNGVNIVKPGGLSQKNSKQFVCARQTIPQRQHHLD